MWRQLFNVITAIAAGVSVAIPALGLAVPAWLAPILTIAAGTAGKLAQTPIPPAPPK